MRTLCFLLLTAPVLAQTTHRVNLDGSADFTDIQSALDAAADGDTVLVAPGEYVITEPINFNRLHDPDDPEVPPVKNIVLRSEAGADSTIIRMDAQWAVVVFMNGESDLSRIEGLTLTGGQGIADGVNEAGVGSRVNPRGGAVVVERSNPQFLSCTISSNVVFGGGGSILGFASTRGGGLFIKDSAVRLDHCKIIDNAAGSGGGVFVEDSQVTIKRCEVSGNYSHGGGGGVTAKGSDLLITDSLIAGNSIPSPGGSSLYLISTSCLVSGSTIVENHGGYLASIPDATRGTIHGVLTSELRLRSSILWGNGAYELESGEYVDLTFNDFPVVVEYSLLPERLGADGIGNTHDDPIFVLGGEWTLGEIERLQDDVWIRGDYRLQSGSPCIDAGTSEGAPSIDIDGNPRPCGKGVDMGAYEFQTEDCTATGRIPGDCNADGNLDVSDGICIFGVLFLGSPSSFPCGDGSATDPGNLSLLDWQPDGGIDISDGIGILQFLFLGGAPHPLAVPGAEQTGLVEIPGCP